MYRIKMRGERVSPWIVPRPMGMGLVLKPVFSFRMTDVVTSVYMPVTTSTASGGKPWSCMTRKVFWWSIVLKALVKSTNMI